MARHQIGLDGRTRDFDGEIRQKRGDTHMGTIEREYGIDLGVRSDMKLETYREQHGDDSLTHILHNKK